MNRIQIDVEKSQAPLRGYPQGHELHEKLPDAKEIKVHPSHSGNENAGLFFVGTATTIIEWEGIRVMTDPNFLHTGDHVHLGPGVVGTRNTNPAIDLLDLPPVDCILLSHYHADHFDQEVEASLRRDLPIITTPHAKAHLGGKTEGEAFTEVHALDFFESLVVDIKKTQPKSDGVPGLKVTGMPGKHIPDGVLGTLNDIVKAIPPTNGWMVELGRTKRSPGAQGWECGYRYDFILTAHHRRLKIAAGSTYRETRSWWMI